MSSKIHSQRNIPFSWEDEPGLSKAGPPDNHLNRHHDDMKLPPPPCPPQHNPRASYHDLQIPLPPCAFQPPSRSSSRRGLKKNDDPFLIAYKEVTKSKKKGGSSLASDVGEFQGFGVRKNMSIFSCKKSSCGVEEGSIVKLSQLPVAKSRRD